MALLAGVAAAGGCGGGGGGGGDDPTVRSSHNVSVAVSAGGSVSPDSSVVTRGGTVSFTITPEAEFQIASATGCGGTLSGSTYTTSPISADCTVAVTFRPVTYPVTASGGTGGTVSPATADVESGATATFTVTPDTGYSIEGVTGCGGALAGDTYTTAPITAACSVEATFVINQYEVTASAGAGGTISPASAQVEHGATAVFVVAPESGYLVDEISGCDGTLDGADYVTGPVTGPCEIAVTFRLPALSGTIIPTGGTAVDNDVNDPLAPYAPNDDTLQAQLVPNPVTLGGYANVPFAGPDGRFFESGDEYDFYRVGVQPGQAISLLIASDDESDDLDLYLIDLEGFIIESSNDEVARTESLFVPADASGEYFVVINAFGGASNYLLTIGQAVADDARPMRLSDEFVPGEAIVRFVDKAGESKSLAWAAPAGAAPASVRLQEGRPRAMLVNLEAATQANELAAAGTAARGHQVPASVLSRLKPRSEHDARKLETLLRIKALARDRATDWAVPNYLYESHAVFTPNDPSYGLQWHYPQIGLPGAWGLNTGTGVTVAVVDSGVSLDHPDLAGRLVAGYDFVLGIAGGNDPGDTPTPPGGSNFHGTHVAGTIAAATNNGLGVAGVAFGARVMPLRACSATGCTSYRIEQALRFAAGLPNDSGTVPAQPAQVINLSLGRDGPALIPEQQLFDELRSRDILVVASAGNSNSSTFAYPAAYDNVIAVSAVDIQGARAYYSNLGPWVDVAAPGGDTLQDRNGDGLPDGVLSTVIDDRSGIGTPAYAIYQGTSMAAPHVAGVLALMRSAAPDLSAQDIENLLRNRRITDDLGAGGKDDEFGYGLINANQAVIAALDASGQPVTLEAFMAASPDTANFGVGLSSIEIEFSNIGGGELTIGTPTENSGGWLSLSSVEADGRLIVTLSVQRAGLEQGFYTATLTVPSSANTVEVDVLMQVAEVLDANVGLQFVLLVDSESLETVDMAVAEPLGGGQQGFRIVDVVPGSYFLISGSDADNDSFICDPGESCGGYPRPGEHRVIEVSGSDIEGLDFPAGYSFTGPTAHRAPVSATPAMPGFRRLPPTNELPRGPR